MSKVLEILQRFQTVQVASGKADETYSMLGKLLQSPPYLLNSKYVESPIAGKLLLDSQTTDDGKQYVLEVVIGKRAEDVIGTLYLPNPMMNVTSEWIRHREELIMLAAKLFNADPMNLGVNDEGRGREVFIREMGTAQIMDVCIERFSAKGWV